jgi:glycosyltransferase involved in cell wall biosynthesis
MAIGTLLHWRPGTRAAGRRRLPGRRRVLFFGTYDARRYPRIRVLQEGFKALGDEVVECNVPLGLDTDMRVRILRRPWLAPLLAFRIALAWARLWRCSRHAGVVDLVVVGYMGHFDVHLARRLWPQVPVVLDHLISAGDTARDRRVSSGLVLRLLERIDRAALRAADVPCVDTPEHLALVAGDAHDRALVVAVGAADEWFHEPEPRDGGPLRVVFFGSFTPLQGTDTIGEAMGRLAGRGDLAFTMVGRGQDYETARAAAAANDAVAWVDWVEPEELPAFVAAHDVCLGIFGTGAKGLRVVPNKVFQGAAAGTAIVTSDTVPQREALGGAAVLVPPGDAAALADALASLAADRARVEELRLAAFRRACAAFTPASVVAPLHARVTPALA